MKTASILALFFVFALTAQGGSRLVLVRIEQPETAWSDSRIYDKLAITMTRDGGLRVAPAEAKTVQETAFPGDPLDAQAIADWAKPKQAQFVMVVLVHSERLETRKTFNVPLVFHRYETYGVIEGELRLIDVTRSKVVRATPFSVDLPATRIFQATMDEDVNDPDLHLTSPNKQQFFSRLEDKLVDRLMELVRGPIGRYDREYVSQPQDKN